MEEEREDPSPSLSDTVCFPSSRSLSTYTSALLTMDTITGIHIIMLGYTYISQQYYRVP